MNNGNLYFNLSKVLLFFLTPILYLFYYPRPYYISRWYDAEANFISNLSSFYIDGFVVDFLHPDTLIIFIGSLFINFVGNFENVEDLIINLRLFYTYLNLIIIFLSLKYILNFKIENIILFYTFLLIFPNTANFIGFLSPQEPLIGLGVLLVAISIRLLENYKNYSFAYGLILGLGVSVKFTFILLSFPFFLALFLKFIISKYNFIYFKILIIIFITFIITFLISAFPILPMLPIYITQWISSEILYELFFKYSYIVLFSSIIFIFFISLIFYLLFNFFKDYDLINIYIYISYVFLTLFLVNFILSLFIYDFLIHAASSRSRNFIPLVCLLVLIFKNKHLEYFLKFKKLLLIIFFLASLLKVFNNYNLSVYANNINNSFENYVKYQSNKENNIVFYPSSFFSSKDYFLTWADYRYGDRITNFNDQRDNLPFKFNNYKIKIDIFNANHFNTNIEKRPAYKYLQNILKIKNLSKTHKNIVLNNIYYLKEKNVCTTPYNSFRKKDNFVIIIPNDLTYLITDIKSLKYINFNTNDYINDLVHNLKKECNFQVKHEIEKIDELLINAIYVES